MKSSVRVIIVALVVNLTIVKTLKCQDFLEIGNEWITEVNNYQIGGGFYEQSIQSIRVSKDTLINGTSYKKLESTNASPCGIFRRSEYLREENSKIYRLNSDFEGELLMLDLNEEESFQLVYESGFTNEMIETEVLIDSTGTFFLPDGNELKVKYVRIKNNSSYSDEETYILSNRVGFIQWGFLFPDIGTGLCDTYLESKLRCYISQTDTLHFQEIDDCYEIKVSSSNQNVFTNQISIFPNPTQHEVNIESGFQVQYVSDMFGKKLDFVHNGQSINMQHLPKGIYLFLLQEKSTGRQHSRMVVKN